VSQVRHTFNVPDLGEGLVNLTVLEWQVTVGERVVLNADLVEVETTKATMVLPSPVTGTVLEFHAQPGEIVPVGDPLVTFEVDDQAGIVGAVPTSQRPTRRVRLRRPNDDGEQG
jgi:pyruvate/2-oxoglutarate dehydrogenase complex dihydrolipoamide acyltransferase (E2) component